jgi:prevent-host-death family protein
MIVAMKFSPQVKPISYLKSHAAQIVSDISESRQPLLITQNGEAKLVVIMDVHSYEEQEHYGTPVNSRDGFEGNPAR